MGTSIRVGARTPVDGESPPLYQIFQAQEGDTVESVAAEFDIAPAYILANNRNLASHALLSGESLIIPPGNGILRQILLGETLTDIATEYDVAPAAIIAFPANHLTGPDDLRETQWVFVPGAHIPIRPASPASPASGG